MKVLVIGSGAREHAMVWKLRQSRHVTQIYAAPGSDGMASLAECVPLKPTQLRELADFARERKIDLTVVGPEDPLVDGIVDLFQRRGLRIYGPTQKAARLEGSKAFAKEIMSRNGIQTGGHKVYESAQPALEYLGNCDYPIVIKADGLAAGKGVTVAKTQEQAEAAVREAMVAKRFGAAGRKLLIEDFLQGEEVSAHAITDGHTILPLCLAQDHKAVGDGDTGENTGGMGTYSPLPQVSDEHLAAIERDVLVQTVHAMNREDVPFKGTLFAGLMMTRQGPKVLEYNVRFGDPETQSILMRMKGDFYEVLSATVDGKLDTVEVDWDPRAVVTVVLASGGYPREFEKGYKIRGLDSDFGPDVQVFHAGTKRVDGQWYTNGGRVLSVVAAGADLPDARRKAYDAIAKIQYDRMVFRKDIGWRALKAQEGRK
ncbi:MAG: phosphoribosylamine--glycine ligase [Planctomycetes bacterium]|nr:phosphoribosylamine--glycine ligase [Planctomycetota bacterium]